MRKTQLLDPARKKLVIMYKASLRSEIAVKEVYMLSLFNLPRVH
jgi:hypothetical protein